VLFVFYLYRWAGIRTAVLLYCFCESCCHCWLCRLGRRELPNGNFEVGVHIADVTHFLKVDTAMDLEAASRATTTYLVQRRIDMLPKPLTEDICSLRCAKITAPFTIRSFASWPGCVSPVCVVCPQVPGWAGVAFLCLHASRVPQLMAPCLNQSMTGRNCFSFFYQQYNSASLPLMTMGQLWLCPSSPSWALKVLLPVQRIFTCHWPAMSVFVDQCDVSGVVSNGWHSVQYGR
jgi:hypothetical protein